MLNKLNKNKLWAGFELATPALPMRSTNHYATKADKKNKEKEGLK